MFQPSLHQQAIFEFVEHGYGNAFIRAAAGSGKTTTILKALEHVPPYLKPLFLAFNREVAKALAKRIPNHATASGIHQLGLTMLTTLHPMGDVNQLKYYTIAEAVLRKNYKTGFELDKFKLRKLVVEYAKYVRIKLLNPRDSDAMRKLAHQQGLSTLFFKEELAAFAAKRHAALCRIQQAERAEREFSEAFYATDICDWVADVLHEGYEGTVYRGEIDYDDMLWVPNVIPPAGRNWPLYDIIFVDEAQDLSRVQRELTLLALRPGGRIVFVLDPNQAIYSFTGADANSVEELRNLPMMEEFPLSVCYRCPRSHVELAQQQSPDIEAAPWAIEGAVYRIHVDDLVTAVRQGDLVMCRTNAPLYQLCLDLLDKDIPATILGRDIVKDFMGITKFVAARERKEPADTLRAHLAAYLGDRTEAWQGLEDAEMQGADLKDQLNVLLTIANRRNLQRVDEVVAILKYLTQDRPNPVKLSSIHRAKGLEADNTFLLRPDLIPHTKATRPAEKAQEKNLLHIALTRARHSLTFVEASAR